VRVALGLVEELYVLKETFKDINRSTRIYARRVQRGTNLCGQLHTLQRTGDADLRF